VVSTISSRKRAVVFMWYNDDGMGDWKVSWVDEIDDDLNVASVFTNQSLGQIFSYWLLLPLYCSFSCVFRNTLICNM
jgi:hypothetical protein